MKVTKHHTGSKELFMQEREADFQKIKDWDGKDEIKDRRPFPSLPMKWHSNKWVNVLLGKQ
jgi:hypothetical protein